MDTVEIIGERCLAAFRNGALDEPALRGLIAAAATAEPRRQSLLYLQTGGTSVAAEAIGMALVVDGRVEDGPEDPARWPYRSVLAAMRDGWRVVKFPDASALLDADHTYGLGCEFILERWS